MSGIDFHCAMSFTQVIFLPIIVPDIVMGIALLMFYAQTRIPLGNRLNHHRSRPLSTSPMWAIIVRARLKGFDRSVEEAAMDLGRHAMANLLVNHVAAHRARRDRRRPAGVYAFH